MADVLLLGGAARGPHWVGDGVKDPHGPAWAWAVRGLAAEVGRDSLFPCAVAAAAAAAGKREVAFPETAAAADCVCEVSACGCGCCAGGDVGGLKPVTTTSAAGWA